MGWNSVAGICSLQLYLRHGRRKNRQLPCQLPMAQPAWEFYHNATTYNTTSTPPLLQTITPPNWQCIASPFCCLLHSSSWPILRQAGGRCFGEDCLYDAAAYGWPLTTPYFRAWVVLVGHISLVAVGTVLLWLGPRAPQFFVPATVQHQYNNNDASRNASTTTANSDSSNTAWRWFHWQIWHFQWWMWVLGGYLVSSWASMSPTGPTIASDIRGSAATRLSQFVVPETRLRCRFSSGLYGSLCDGTRLGRSAVSLVDRIDAMEGDSTLAVVLQAAVFSAHHMSLTAALPLFVGILCGLAPTS